MEEGGRDRLGPCTPVCLEPVVFLNWMLSAERLSGAFGKRLILDCIFQIQVAELVQGGKMVAVSVICLSVALVFRSLLAGGFSTLSFSLLDFVNSPLLVLATVLLLLVVVFAVRKLRGFL
jgi:hypothetical protein